MVDARRWWWFSPYIRRSDCERFGLQNVLHLHQLGCRTNIRRWGGVRLSRKVVRVRVVVSCSLPSGDPALYLQHVDAHSLGGGGLDIRSPGGWPLTGASSFIYSRLVRGKVITLLAATGVDVSSRTRRDSASEWSRMYAA